jgi:hypothetical protein
MLRGRQEWDHPVRNLLSPPPTHSSSCKGLYFEPLQFMAGRLFTLGLPDGIFSHQKYYFAYILEGIEIENLVKFMAYKMLYSHMVYFEAIWCILSRFGILQQEESGNPGSRAIGHDGGGHSS